MQETERDKIVAAVETPAFVVDLRAVAAVAEAYQRIRQETGVQVLYATKPLLHRDVLELLAERLDGFTASSLFSAQLCRAVLGGSPLLSVTTPAYRESELEALADCSDRIVLNSLPQWERFGARLAGEVSVGLRVNPGLSYLPDARYDPGRPGGKLGIPLVILAQTPLAELEGITGLHFHSNCESPNYTPLWETVNALMEPLDGLLQRVAWINIGGGYRLPHRDEWGPLYRAIALLQSRYPQAVVTMEPGAPLVRSAGQLVATVVDLFATEEGTVAALDTTVNHLPEVFEYQYAPEVVGHDDENPFAYHLVGATCLAGDHFGVYRFAEPLMVGSRVCFPEVGAYSLAKAHWFNGVALPTLYTVDRTGQLHRRRRFDLTDYKAHTGWVPEETA